MTEKWIQLRQWANGLPSRKDGSVSFLWLCGAMAVAVGLSNILVQYPVNHTLAFAGTTLLLSDYITYGAFTYPITFILNDATNYLYGAKSARRVVVLGFWMGIIMGILLVWGHLTTVRILTASALAFLIGQLIDIALFRFSSAFSWYARPVISSTIAGAVDSVIFFGIAFYGTGLPWLQMAAGDYLVKCLMIVLMLVPYRRLIKQALVGSRLISPRASL